jgi:hypothetical protein
MTLLVICTFLDQLNRYLYIASRPGHLSDRLLYVLKTGASGLFSSYPIPYLGYEWSVLSSRTYVIGRARPFYPPIWTKSAEPERRGCISGQLLLLACSRWLMLNDVPLHGPTLAESTS